MKKIRQQEEARVSDEAIVSDDPAGQHNPQGSQGPLDWSVLSEKETTFFLEIWTYTTYKSPLGDEGRGGIPV